ncbi:MAG: geranylgeranylglyceryl/heptaprenylglyceryl phosphate synthase [Candidatus Micrarchaeota archaeon]|nr:geranylgeranylglyceryl/heptaprenylglyceryl phosphate synthase [Candidatus Micrarchaeota archaeon]
MKPGKVELYIHEVLESKGSMLFSLIDPLDYDSLDVAVKTAKATSDGGADIVLIGGSTGAQGEILDEASKRIKEAIDVPLILFPGNIGTITRHTDAIYFMSLMNARNPYWMTQAQALSAPIVQAYSVEPLPIGYIVVYPGGTAGWIGDANFVPREKPKIAASLALAGEYLGNRFILTDTGSNPKLQNSGPIPKEMIAAVKKSISIPYIVGGGITDTADLRAAYAAGADIVQIGTAFETPAMAGKRAQAFSRIAREEGAKKLKG